MQFREMIAVDGKTLGESLPVRPKKLVSLFRRHGFEFADLNGRLVLNQPYSPERWGALQKVIDAAALDVGTEHSIWPVYDENDYAASPLWMLIFPDIFIDNVSCLKKCERCGREGIKVDPAARVGKVKSKKATLAVNGSCEIVSAAAKAAIEADLAGAVFTPFDEQDSYFLIRSRMDLGPLVLREEEFLNLRGTCQQCGDPMFDIFFGPLRYPRTRWNGDDIVGSHFAIGNLYSPKAYRVLKSLEPSIMRMAPVVLE